MGQGKGIELPVSVPGADKAVADLGKVGGAARKLGAGDLASIGRTASSQTGAIKDHAKATEELGEAGSKAGKGLKKSEDGAEGLHNKGEKLFKQLAGMLNPELANMADLAFDLFEGFSKLTPMLLRIGIPAAVIGGIIAGFKAISASIEEARKAKERFDEAMKKQRDAGLELRGKVFDAVQKAGIITEAKGQDELVVQANRLKAAGLDDQQAIDAAVGAELLDVEGKRGPTDRLDLARGMALTGKPLKLEPDAPEQGKSEEAQRAAMVAEVERIRDLGRTRDAQDQFARTLQGKGEQGKREKLVDKEITEVGIQEYLDTLAANMQSERGLKDDEIKIIRRLAGRPEGPLLKRESVANIKAAVPEFTFWETLPTLVNTGFPGLSSDFLMKGKPGDSSLTLEQLNAAAIEMRNAAAELRAATKDGYGASRSIVERRQNVYITNSYGRSDPFMSKPAPSGPEDLDGMD